MSSAHQAKKQFNLDSGWLEQQQKIERKYIQEQQPNQFHCYNQNMGFVNTMDQYSEVNYRTSIQMKKWWCPRTFEW